MSLQQKRVWRYVEEGSLLKLKSYLRKHRDLDVNFSQGKRERSPLQLACCRGEDAVLRLLLKHGADVLQKDRKGDTALHTAVSEVFKCGRRAYTDLVVPLRNSCPDALNAPNSAGVTPKDMLKMWKKHSKTTENLRSLTEELEKINKKFVELSKAFNAIDGLPDDDDDDDDEDFKDWAERIRNEYFDKMRNATGGTPSSSGWRSWKSKQERDHLKARKEEEARQGEKRRYDEGCAATFNAGSSSVSTKLSYSDIPWPAPRGTVQEMVDVMLHGVDRKDLPLFRKMLRKQQALWHPDKFAQRCEARLEEKDKTQILDTVTALSQELNRLAQSLRDLKI
ncbi:NF-kappa-B inhibitor-like protein 1 [Morone saxatilis]|uniref:NF-kappa-B inhibitor-like protein 1 n=1 Tax=Morone saxatilis TaxID=34816 RepID=UPI0015E1C857|nr:NF-kappa-B inhibitor-like protein 1 [Morone saxatilis]